MSGDLGSAAIAAGVSLVVATGTVTIAYLTTRASLRRDHERQDADFRRKMTDRLYDRRVAVYPGLFAATDGFRRSQLAATPDLREHLQRVMATVNDWHSHEGGLMLSDAAYRRLADLREAVRAILSEPAASARLPELMHELWECKNRLREAMRADLGLLFDEDQAV